MLLTERLHTCGESVGLTTVFERGSVQIFSEQFDDRTRASDPPSSRTYSLGFSSLRGTHPAFSAKEPDKPSMYAHLSKLVLS